MNKLKLFDVILNNIYKRRVTRETLTTLLGSYKDTHEIQSALESITNDRVLFWIITAKNILNDE